MNSSVHSLAIFYSKSILVCIEIPVSRGGDPEQGFGAVLQMEKREEGLNRGFYCR